MAASGYIGAPPLDSLADVDTTGVTSGKVLKYDGAQWVDGTDLTGGGGGGGTVDWADITSKPSTFPPTLPIAQADVTNLVADLSSLASSVATKASKSRKARQIISDQGRAGLPSPAWAPMSGWPTVSVTAAVGDEIEVVFGGVKKPGYAAVDAGVVVGGSIVRYLATNTDTPAVEGAPGWNANVENFVGNSVTAGFTVASGDISGGTVTVAVVAKSVSGSETLDGSVAYPFRLEITNRGVMS